jgi:hypothetical protein
MFVPNIRVDNRGKIGLSMGDDSIFNPFSGSFDFLNGISRARLLLDKVLTFDGTTALTISIDGVPHVLTIDPENNE